MKMNAALVGCAFFKKRDVALFGFEPAGRPDATALRAYFDNAWSVWDLEPEWTAVGIGCAKYPATDSWIAVAGSAEGRLWQLDLGTGDEKELKIPGDYSGLTRYAAFDNAIWACGMDRILLRREQNGSWTDLSAPQAALSEGVIGFTGIAAPGPGEIVAVGWRGEIWWRDAAGTWTPQDSGTNANFNAVSVGPDGNVVVVGDDGAVVTGRRDQWTVLDVDTNFNLQGVCHYQKEVFVSTDFELYRLDNDNLVLEDRFAGNDEPGTCMNLIAGSESVFSQGEKDIFRYDGTVWSRIF